ncbi:MAG: DNRLRE domain-containing protein [Candidatus Hodarchaeales archaeon]|jgi:hypothetical protein
MIKPEKMIPVLIVILSLFPIMSVQSTPVSINLDATHDTEIRETESTTNFGSVNHAYIGKNPLSSPNRRHALFMFNISGYSSITSATLHLKLYGSSAGTKDFRVHRVTESWDESTLVWNDNITYDATVEASLSVGPWNFIITDLVSEWINGTYSNYGLIIEGDNMVGANWMAFYTSEETGESNKPKLGLIGEVVVENEPVLLFIFGSVAICSVLLKKKAKENEQA